MSSRAVTIRTNPGDQQKWSTPYSCALALVVVVFAVMAVSSLWAQTSTTGDIVGVVTDPTAAVLSGVSVTLKNVDTGSSTSATTNSQGSCNFPFLQPGHYSVSATAAGFQEIVKNVTVALGSSVTANLQLSISSQSQTIEVTREGTGIQTEDANVETNINAQQLAVLPNPGNDLSAVALTAPGVVMNTTGGSVFGGGNYELFGLPANSNVFTYDGANDNDPYFNINNSGATNLTLGLNDVQETSAVTNGYSGQFVGLAGAVSYPNSTLPQSIGRGGSTHFFRCRASKNPNENNQKPQRPGQENFSMQSEAPNIDQSQPDLREKIGEAISALSELSDILPSGDDRNPILEQLEALHIEHQSEPVSHAALKKICQEVSKLLERLDANLG